MRNINVMSYKNGHYANYKRKYWNISQSSSGVLGVVSNVSKKKKKKKKKKFNVSIYAFTLSLGYSGFVCTDRVCIHVIPPSSSGRLQEMSRKIDKISSKMYHFLTKIQNLPEMNQEFSYIFYIFFKNLPEIEEKSS